MNLLFLGFAPRFGFKWGVASMPFLFGCGALRWPRWWGVLGVTPLASPRPASRCLQCRGSARPPELVQLRGCTDTFPFCQTLQRAIWIPLLYKKGLEAPLSDLPAVVSAIQTQVGFGGGSVQPVGALLAF